MNIEHTCPMCEKGKLIPQKPIDEEYAYKGQTYTVKGIEYTTCPVCDSEITTPEQIKRNRARAMEAKRKLEGFLSADEVKALRAAYNLTQEQASKIFGGGTNAFSKYERSEVMQSAVMDKLMRLAIDIPQSFEYLCKMSNVPFEESQKFHYSAESKLFAEKVIQAIQRNELNTSDLTTKLSALQVARWFTHAINRNAGDTISHLKLQKLIYYFQSWHVAIFKTTVFDEPFQAWCHGPVVPDIYDEYKCYGKSDIPEPESFVCDTEPHEYQKKLMQLILNHYGELSASHLETITHKEYPWKSTRGNKNPEDKSQEVIPINKIAQYYGSLLQHTYALT